jgi:homocysteine S-methyltransferase
MADTLRDLIADGRTHVLDGAMGTMLYNRGVFVNVCYDELNLREPDIVREVHAAYVRAGAEIIETNTFGGNPVKLSSHGLDARTEEINRVAVDIARAAANGRACVAGAIGPLGIRIEPWGPTGRDDAEAYFGRQVRGLVEGGVDGFILETFSDVEELLTAVRAVRAQSDLPIIAQTTVGEDGKTSYGTTIEKIVAALHTHAVDVIGFNCSVGPAAMLDAVERLAELTDRPISAQPNAGLPRAVGDRKIYLASPEYMGQYARRLIEAGARFVGGCCGTTPDHVKTIHDYVASLHPRRAPVISVGPTAELASAVQPAPLAERSGLGKRLATGQFVTTVELVPPRGWESAPLVAEGRRLKEAGVDAVSVVDSPRGRSRMGVLPAAFLLEREVGVETVMHYTCRDRNMLGMLSDLLGAAAAGIRNILIITGDPPAMGPYPDATAVFDIDAIGLTNVVHRLNHGLDPGGSTIGEPTRYVIGVALNQGAVDLDKEIERYGWKVEAGAEFAVTQPVFDVPQLEQFFERTKQWNVPALAGIWPLTSLRNAEFLANEVPGVHVPPEVLDRMRGAQAHGSDAARAEGTAIALEVYERVRPLVHGVQISVPYGGVETALSFLDATASSRAPT